jgi:hypothetical protein
MRIREFLLAAFAGLIFCGLCQAQPTQLTIDRNAGIARLTVQGEANRDYTLQTSDLSSTNWTFLSTLSLYNQTQSWFDSDSSWSPMRFYRAVKLATNQFGRIYQYADDFRLIDHQGVSRSLYYLENDPKVKAVVLLFTGNGCANVAQLVSTIKSLRDQFTPQGIVFWMVDANSADNRSNIVAEANALGIDLPILHDRSQLVARAFHASTTPEVICIDKLGWPIFYRGTIDDRVGPAPAPTTQNYLSNALTSFLAGGTVSPREAHTNGCAITLTSIPMPDYSADVAPLLQAKCIGCHSPGNLAPFALTNYSSVTNKMMAMRLELLKGTMPPWHADYNFQSYTNDFSLSSTQASTLMSWIDAGGPRGTGPDPLTNPPPPVDYPFAWPAALGTPDIIIPVGSQSIPATGVIPYQYVNYTYMGPPVWLRAAVMLPGTVPVVHHILAYVGTSSSTTIQTFMTGYVPGAYLGAFPEGTGKLLTNNTPLQFQLHYKANGTATNDSSLLGLYTMPGPPTNSAGFTNALIETSSYSVLFCVPTNNNDYQFVANSAATSTKIRLFEFSPHLHARGKSFKYEAIYPAGHNPASEVLLSVPYYQFNWQTAYRLAQPKDLPANTVIRVTAHWDNSIQNADLMELYNEQSGTNPNWPLYSPSYVNHPTQCPTGIIFDQQTWDEMFIGYFNYIVLQ